MSTMPYPSSSRYYSRSDKFVEVHRQEWDAIVKLCATPVGKWSAEEVRSFPGSFRRLCNQLNSAREQRLSIKTLRFLNELVGRAHQVLYQKSVPKSDGLRTYLFRTIPATLRGSWLFILISALFFLGSFLASLGISMHNPDFAARIVPQEQLQMFEDMYSGDTFENRHVSMRFEMASYYIQHNISIAYISFASGILGGIGSLYTTLYQGLFLGAVAGYVDGTTGRNDFWQFVTAHSVFELTGLMIAAAAGLYLGWTIIAAGRKSRKQNLKEATPRIIGLLVPATLFLLFAAFIEGSISPVPVGMPIRLGILAFSVVVVAGFFLMGVRLGKPDRTAADERAVSGITGASEKPGEEGWR